jgi:hypothetical protein
LWSRRCACYYYRCEECAALEIQSKPDGKNRKRKRTPSEDSRSRSGHHEEQNGDTDGNASGDAAEKVQGRQGNGDAMNANDTEGTLLDDIVAGSRTNPPQFSPALLRDKSCAHASYSADSDGDDGAYKQACDEAVSTTSAAGCEFAERSAASYAVLIANTTAAASSSPATAAQIAVSNEHRDPLTCVVKGSAADVTLKRMFFWTLVSSSLV